MLGGADRWCICTFTVGSRTHLIARVPPDMADEVARMAAEQDRSVSAEIRRALREHIAHNDDSRPREGPPIATTPAGHEPAHER